MKKIGTKYTDSDIIYEIIDAELHEIGLIQGHSRLLAPKRVKIQGIAAHAMRRLQERNATPELAQHYIDTAIAMIQESKDKFEFIAEDGSSVILDYGKLLTVIPREYFTETQIKKVEVIEKWLK